MSKSAPADGDRRQQILEAALDVFAEQGFEKATTKEIATRVGVAQGLVYFYFASKVELLIAACEHQTKLALSCLDAWRNVEQDVPPPVALRNMLTRFIQILDEPRTSKLLRVAALTHPPAEQKKREDARVQQEVPVSHVSSDNQYKQPINALALRLGEELHEHLQRNLPGYPRPAEILIEADFFSGAITSTLIRRALNHKEKSAITQLSQSQLIELLASNLFAWLAVKQAIALSIPG